MADSSPQISTATCFCGTVKLEFPVEGPDMPAAFVCHCADCRKFTASMFASNFCVMDKALTHLQGQENLSSWSTNKTIDRGHTMTNYFCKTCGSLMYRRGTGFPGMYITRIGTVDDLELANTKLKPTVEQFLKRRADWVQGVKGVEKTAEGQFEF